MSDIKLDPIYNIHNSVDLNLGALTKSAHLIRFHRATIHRTKPRLVAFESTDLGTKEMCAQIVK